MSKTTVRFYIDPPAPDESLSSVLDRASALYELDTDEVAAAMLGDDGDDPASIDWDNPGDHVLDLFAEALQMDVQRLRGQLIQDGPSWLRPGRRYAFCPACLEEDRISGRSPYFRRDWARLFVTFCNRHKCPLLAWRWNPIARRRKPFRALPKEWQTSERLNVPLTSRLFAPVYDAKERFPIYAAERLYSLKVNGAAEFSEKLMLWESAIQALTIAVGDVSTCGIPHMEQIGKILTLVGTVHGWGQIKSFDRYLYLLNGGWQLTRHLSSGQRLPEVPAEGRWGSLRALGSPAERRAALCLTACTVEPDWPIEMFLTGTNARSGTTDWYEQVLVEMVGRPEVGVLEKVVAELGIPNWQRRTPRRLPMGV